MKLLAIGLSVLIPVLSIANTVEENIQVAKERYKNPQGQIDCKFPGLSPTGSSSTSKYFATQFKIKDFEFEVQYPHKKRSKPSLVGINKEINVEAYKAGTNVYFKFQNLDSTGKTIVKEYGLGNTKTGFNNIICSTKFGRDKHIEITSKKIHINMHPHYVYDMPANTKESAQSYIDNTDYLSYVLLEKPGRSSWYNNWNVDDVQVEPTLDSIILTAPSGKALFSLASDNIDVTYTGGYINYCILNNTRSLLQSFLQQSNGGKLEITFDSEGLVSQISSFDGNEAMDLPRFVYLQKDFRNDPAMGKKFKNGQFAYYLRWINNTKSMFNKVDYIYKSEGVNKTQTIQGTGDRNYQIVIKYINE